MMEVRRRVILGGKKHLLPNGYTQIQYVYCDGSQPFIAIGDHQGIAELIIWARIKKDADCTEEAAFVGKRGFSGSDFEMYYPKNSQQLASWPVALTTNISRVYGEEYDEHKINFHASNIHYRLIGRFVENKYIYRGKIFEYAEWDVDGHELHHLYPCISPDSVIGFYCTVVKQFYGPETSSVFIAGPAV